jgi:hypothetical protein
MSRGIWQIFRILEPDGAPDRLGDERGARSAFLAADDTGATI